MGAFRKKFFNSHTVDQQARRDTKFSFSFLLVARFAFFARANVILIARLSALLCEFARHFFLSFHAKLLLPRPEGTPNLSSSFSFLSLSLHLLSRGRTRLARGETKIFTRSPFRCWFHAAWFIAYGCFWRGGLFHYRFMEQIDVRGSRNDDVDPSISRSILGRMGRLIFCWTILRSEYDVTYSACC